MESWTEKLTRARRELNDKGQVEDRATKLGNLRAGNSGIMDEKGNVAGACTHEAHLRELGLSAERVTDDKLIMFSMGKLNEVAKLSELNQVLAPGQILKQEGEIPIEWNTKNGTRVTGRPDMVICAPLDLLAPVTHPIEGFELKSIASVYTTGDIAFERMPKLAHLCQAGHYMWKLGIPYNLVYTQYTNQQIPEWKLRQIPELAEQLERVVERKNSKGQRVIKQIVPFEIVYNLDIDSNGYVRYKCEGVDEKWTRTIVQVQAIERFFEYVSEMKYTRVLGPEIITMNALGKEASYSHCKQYCNAHKQLGEYTKDYSLWLEKARELHERLHGPLK